MTIKHYYVSRVIGMLNWVREVLSFTLPKHKCMSLPILEIGS